MDPHLQQYDRHKAHAIAQQYSLSNLYKSETT
jgi:hypothetical protein